MRAVYPFAIRCRSRNPPRVVRIGDASGFSDPIFSSGVMLAMTSGQQGARAVDEALSAGASMTPALRAYEKPTVGASANTGSSSKTSTSRTSPSYFSSPSTACGWSARSTRSSPAAPRCPSRHGGACACSSSSPGSTNTCPSQSGSTSRDCSRAGDLRGRR